MKTAEEIKQNISGIIKKLRPLVESLSSFLGTIDTLLKLNDITNAEYVARAAKSVSESICGDVSWIYKLIYDLKDAIEREARKAPIHELDLP